jgi:hypothetical protein
MSFDIPIAIEPEIIQYAQAEHITEAEAIVRLIQAGLSASHREAQDQNAILSGLGLFADPADAAVLDEAVAIAYEERRRPSGQAL